MVGRLHPQRLSALFSPRADCSTRMTDHCRAMRTVAGDRRAGYSDPTFACRRAERCAASTRRTSGSGPAAIWNTPRSGFCTRRLRWRRSRSCSARLLADREVIPQAMKLNPGFFQDRLHRPAQYQEDQAKCAGGTVRHRWLPGRTDCRRCSAWSSSICGKSARRARPPNSKHHFERNFGVGGVTGVCEYLADRGLIGKARLPVAADPKEQDRSGGDGVFLRQRTARCLLNHETRSAYHHRHSGRARPQPEERLARDCRATS